MIQEKKHSAIFCIDDLEVPVMSTNFSDGAGCGTSGQGKEEIFGQAKTTTSDDAEFKSKPSEWLTDTVGPSNFYPDDAKYFMYVMNGAALTPQQKARLWHWRLGHPAADVPFTMCKKGAGLGVTEAMLGDCAVCDKSEVQEEAAQETAVISQVQHCTILQNLR